MLASDWLVCFKFLTSYILQFSLDSTKDMKSNEKFSLWFDLIWFDVSSTLCASVLALPVNLRANSNTDSLFRVRSHLHAPTKEPIYGQGVVPFNLNCYLEEEEEGESKIRQSVAQSRSFCNFRKLKEHPLLLWAQYKLFNLPGGAFRQW